MKITNEMWLVFMVVQNWILIVYLFLCLEAMKHGLHI